MPGLGAAGQWEAPVSPAVVWGCCLCLRISAPGWVWAGFALTPSSGGELPAGDSGCTGHRFPEGMELSVHSCLELGSSEDPVESRACLCQVLPTSGATVIEGALGGDKNSPE